MLKQLESLKTYSTEGITAHSNPAVKIKSICKDLNEAQDDGARP